MPKPTLEPFLWMAFSAGGALAAMFLPVLIALFGFAIPLGWVAAPSYAHVASVLGHPIARLVLFAVCSLSLVHWAHRFRYTLYDGLQIKHLNEMVNLFCYGGAVAGSLWALWVLT
jgi:fumarate reductase subunit D